MASIELVKGSDGSGNANVATVQNTRAPAATTIDVDTVLGINPAGFAGTMGTPHTFTDPITSETITVISEATAVDFTGHVDGANLEIDDIAPGYVDAGSAVGDIVIIRPTTQYADNLAETLEAAHNDDGTLKNDSVDTAQIAADAVEHAEVAAGFMVQTVSVGASAQASGSGTIPRDDTIPQSGEGNEFLTLAITPKSATDILVIRTVLFLSSSIAGHFVAALFQDAGANALAAASQYQATVEGPISLVLEHRMVAGTTSSTTFKIRAGMTAAGSVYLNGDSSGRRYGAISKSTLVIEEYKA